MHQKTKKGMPSAIRVEFFSKIVKQTGSNNRVGKTSKELSNPVLLIDTTE